MKNLYLLLCCIFICSFNTGYAQSDKLGVKKSISFNGSLSVGGFFYSTNRPVSLLSPYGYAVGLNASASIGSIDIPINLSVNEQGSAFRHPFNRFGISPKYKWIKLHLGHRNYRWSEFLMSGVTILGAGLELNPGSFRLQGVTGRIPPPQGFGLGSYGNEQFERQIKAARIGVEAEGNEWYITLLQGKDDLASLPDQTVEVTNMIPANENLAVGSNLKIPFWKDKIFLKGEGALSAFTEDIRLKNISLDSFPDFEKYAGIMDFNASTHATWAYKGELHFNLNKFSLAGIYRKVAPEFKSFGTNYLLTDMESITINPSFQLWEGKAIISGSYGVQYNNLDERLAAKTNRNIGSFDININPSPNFGAFFQYSNYSLYQQVIRDSLSNDSILIDQVSQNYTFAPRLTFANSERIHNLMVSLNYQILDDKNTFTESFSDNDLLALNANYILTFINLGLNINAGMNYLTFNSSSFNSQQVGIILGGKKKLFNNKLNIGLTANFSKLNSNEVENTLTTLLINADYAIHKKASLRFQLYALNNQSVLNPISEMRGQVNYRYRF